MMRAVSIVAAIAAAASINTRGFDLIAAWIFPCSSKKMPVLTPHPMQWCPGWLHRYVKGSAVSMMVPSASVVR